MKMITALCALLTGCLALAGPSTGEIEITPLSQRKSLQDLYAEQTFNDVYGLRQQRRIGVGAQLLGSSGLMSANIELNFKPEDSSIVSFGGGPGYNAFSLLWKHTFQVKEWAPHAILGYAHWYNSSPNGYGGARTNPSVLSEKWLTSKEKSLGEFRVDLLTSGVGVSFYNTKGASRGVSYFGELIVLTRLSNPEPTPLGSFGTFFYF